MAFIPATGTNSDTANSYCDLAFANAYHGARGNEAWVVATDQKKQQALIRATDFIERNYSGVWLGTIDPDFVGLSWPRKELTKYNSTTIPGQLKNAVCELAAEALAGDLSPVVDLTKPIVKRKKVDVLETEYFAPSAQAGKSRPVVYGYLAGLTIPRNPFNLKNVRV